MRPGFITEDLGISEITIRVHPSVTIQSYEGGTAGRGYWGAVGIRLRRGSGRPTKRGDTGLSRVRPGLPCAQAQRPKRLQATHDLRITVVFPF